MGFLPQAHFSDKNCLFFERSDFFHKVYDGSPQIPKKIGLIDRKAIVKMRLSSSKSPKYFSHYVQKTRHFPSLTDFYMDGASGLVTPFKIGGNLDEIFNSTQHCLITDVLSQHLVASHGQTKIYSPSSESLNFENFLPQTARHWAGNLKSSI